MFKKMLICGLAVSLGLYGAEAEALRFKASKEAIDAAKDALKKGGDALIDRLIPGGDNEVAHDVFHDVVDVHPVRAVARIVLEPSKLEKEPDIVYVEPGPPVVPASPANANAIPTEHPVDRMHDLFLGPVTPFLTPDVGRTVVHGADHGQGGHEGGHTGGWAGPDHPTAGNIG
jgi:hypothetical protein